ncbi:MAG: helix-turn-helix domain-containing protein [Oscillospiraceae bacterium]|nr:helix-turn-helix domain-containing protein [Oscillospiraceae bacterium]
MYLAENLKIMRKSMDMTQEDVAEVVGVSPQSVSKWERGDTFPDITLLPSLANLYKTSIDNLIGMEKINDDKARAKAFLDGQMLLRDGDSSGAADIFTKALKLYPNDESIMLELALVYALDGDPEKLGKAEVLCERIISGKPSDTVLCTARAVLCYIFLKYGDNEKAVTAAQLLPHEAVCRFTVLKEIEKNPDTEDINKCLFRIMSRDNAEHDILVIDFGLDMLPMIEEGKLLEKIKETREKTGKDKKARDKIPPVRIRDNPGLSPNQVRLRYYTDYLLNKQFTSPAAAVSDILKILLKISKNS